MKLIGSLTSPYVRKARIVLAEKKMEYEFVLENVHAPDTTIDQFIGQHHTRTTSMRNNGNSFILEWFEMKNGCMIHQLHSTEATDHTGLSKQGADGEVGT